MVQIVDFSITLDDGSIFQFRCIQSMAFESEFVGKGLDEMGFHILQVNTILRTLWPCKGRENRSQIKFQNIRVRFLSIACTVPKALSLGEGFNTSKSFLISTSQSKVFDGTFVNREESTGCTVFRSHVSNRGSICQRKCGHTFAKEFDEFSNNTMLTKHLNDSKCHIGCSYTIVE